MTSERIQQHKTKIAVNARRDSPTADAQDSSDSNEPCFLLALSNQEYDIKEVGVVDGVFLVVQEHPCEVLCQLIVVLKLVSN